MRSLAGSWLAEDIGRGDVTTRAVVRPERSGRARIEARESAVVSGLEVARMCFDVVSDGTLEFEPRTRDGVSVAAGDQLARVSGMLAPILTAERTALNALARMCGIATLTSEFVRAIGGTAATIADTRKTTPGMRVLEKYSVRVGGGTNHRSGLDDGVLIKDNHIVAAGGVTEAVSRATEFAPHGLRIEVEVADLDQLEDALAAGADAILLDNMSPSEVRQAVLRAGGKALLEVSGGVTLETVRSYAETGVDLISVGALTHSAPTADIALEVES